MEAQPLFSTGVGCALLLPQTAAAVPRPLAHAHGHRSMAINTPPLHQLTMNYRTHQGVLDVAALVVDVLRRFFPRQARQGQRHCARHQGLMGCNPTLCMRCLHKGFSALPPMVPLPLQHGSSLSPPPPPPPRPPAPHPIPYPCTARSWTSCSASGRCSLARTRCCWAASAWMTWPSCSAARRATCRRSSSARTR